MKNSNKLILFVVLIFVVIASVYVIVEKNRSATPESLDRQVYVH